MGLSQDQVQETLDVAFETLEQAMEGGSDIKYVDVSQLASDFTPSKLPGILALMVVTGFSAALIVLVILLVVQGVMQ